MISWKSFPGRRLEENILIYQRDVGDEILCPFPWMRPILLGWWWWYRLGERGYGRGEWEPGLGGGELRSSSGLLYGARSKRLGKPQSHRTYEAGERALFFSRMTRPSNAAELLAACILQPFSPTPALNNIFIDARLSQANRSVFID